MKTLLAVDGSKNSLRAADYAAHVMKQFPDGMTVLVFVDTLITYIKTRGGVLPTNFEEINDIEVKEALKKAESYFEEKNTPYQAKVLEGWDIAETICDYAKEIECNQIIMGTRGLGNIRGIILGSVSHKVIQIAPCPVTFVK